MKQLPYVAYDITPPAPMVKARLLYRRKSGGAENDGAKRRESTASKTYLKSCMYLPRVEWRSTNMARGCGILCHLLLLCSHVDIWFAKARAAQTTVNTCAYKTTGIAKNNLVVPSVLHTAVDKACRVLSRDTTVLRKVPSTCDQ